MKKSHYILVVLILLLTGFGFYQSLYFGMASLDQYAVSNMLKLWQNNPSEHTNKDYLHTKAKAQQAVLNHPQNAEYWALLAQVSEWGTIFGYEQTESGLSEAKKHYLRATELRPLWPDTWAGLIKLKWRSQEFDQEMLYFFEQATKYGPQKPEIHLVVIELGMALYASKHLMLLNIKSEFHHRLALGLKHPGTKSRVLKLISQYEAQKPVCQWLKNEDVNTRKLIPKCK